MTSISSVTEASRQVISIRAYKLVKHGFMIRDDEDFKLTAKGSAVIKDLTLDLSMYHLHWMKATPNLQCQNVD
jgi:predicted transcriptional regulator